MAKQICAACGADHNPERSHCPTCGADYEMAGIGLVDCARCDRIHGPDAEDCHESYTSRRLQEWSGQRRRAP